MRGKYDTREKILKAASRLFQLKGYHATGLNEILKESGAPKGSLYYYFPKGKEELALEAISLTSKSIQKKIRNGLAKVEDPVEAFKLITKEMESYFNREGDVIDISVNLLALETSATSETLRKACELAFDSWKGIYVEKLIKGGFKEEKAQELGAVIQFMVEGAVIMSLTKKDSTPLQIVAEQISLLLRQ